MLALGFCQDLAHARSELLSMIGACIGNGD